MQRPCSQNPGTGDSYLTLLMTGLLRGAQASARHPIKSTCWRPQCSGQAGISVLHIEAVRQDKNENSADITEILSKTHIFAHL